ncbi:MAG: hypothetical protein KGL16_01965, partial [Acidobacteriota bacterium]|nr:hypothetical protein [Acidobacteriota bacterium]
PRRGGAQPAPRTLVMAQPLGPGDPSVPGAGVTAERGRRVPARAVGLVAALVVLGIVLALVASAGGPGTASTSHHGRRSKPSANTTKQSTTTRNAATPATVASAVTALDSLITADMHGGSVDQQAGNAILGDGQAILAAAQNGQSGGPLVGLATKLGNDISNGVVHGDIGGAAIPALNTAVANLYSVLERSAGGVTTPTYSTAGSPGSGAHQPPGQQKKDQGQTVKHHGQDAQGGGQGSGD